MIKPHAWDGSAEQLWDAIAAVRGDRETEGELAVLMDVLTLARAYEGLRVGHEEWADRDWMRAPLTVEESAAIEDAELVEGEEW